MEDTARVYRTYIRTTPERLWEALTAPELTRRYFDFMEGFMAVESHWTPGSAVTYRTEAGGQAQIEGYVLEVQPPARLVTSFALRYDPEVLQDRPSRLSWEVDRLDEDCRLTVTHGDVEGETRTARDVSACMPSILGNLKVLLETGRPRLVKAVVVDCASPATLGTFWAAATGYVLQGPQPAPEDPFVGLADPRGEGPELGFQRVPEPKSGKNRLHLDLHVADVPAEVARLEALGARKAPGFPQSDTWVVMLDPEGNEFCVGG
jgi:uncharacterized protein YndB with AHSA1/START domain